MILIVVSSRCRVPDLLGFHTCRKDVELGIHFFSVLGGPPVAGAPVLHRLHLQNEKQNLNIFTKILLKPGFGQNLSLIQI